VTAQIEQVAREIAELNTPSLPAPSGRLGLKLIPRGLVANAARGLVEGASGGGGAKKFRQTGSFAAGSVGGSNTCRATARRFSCSYQRPTASAVGWRRSRENFPSPPAPVTKLGGQVGLAANRTPVRPGF
jgi:hypothetical protein